MNSFGGRTRGVLAVVVVTAFFALILQADAGAVEVDLDPLLRDESMAQVDEQALVAGGGSWTLSAYDLCDPPQKPISHGNIEFKFLDMPDPQQDISLKLDEYDPVPDPLQTSFPAALLVHGGGGVRGCKYNENAHAYQLASDEFNQWPHHRFIAFAIEYRLACYSSDENLAGSLIRQYCDWPFSRSDASFSPPDGVARGPGIHDVEWALQWIQANAEARCGCDWNGEIYIFSGSWGGNLSFMASARMHAILGGVQPNGISAWSGGLEVQQQHSPEPPPYPWPCSLGMTDNSFECQRVNNQYLGCGLEFYPDPICNNESPSRYAAASPYGVFGSGGPTAGWPGRVFFSNAGCMQPQCNPGATGPELQSYWSAVDFETELHDVFLWKKYPEPLATMRFCAVATNKHAESYINNQKCSGEAVRSVFQSTVDWLLGL